MRAAPLVLFGVTLAGCQDPTVTVRIELPAGPRGDYDEIVERYSVTVLTPEDAPVDCDTLAFGEVDSETIELTRATGVSFATDRASGVSIAGVPREGTKLFLVEGRDAQNVVVVAGCAPKDEIVGDDNVTVVTEASAEIRLDTLHAADQPVPPELVVTVDDGYGGELLPIADRELRWVVYGADAFREPSEAPPTPTITDGDGRATFVPPAPPRFGPVSVQIRARWARTQPLVVPAFTPAEFRDPLSVNLACTLDEDDTLEVGTGLWTRFGYSITANQRIPALAGLAREGSRTYLYVAVWNGSDAQDGCSDALPPAESFTLLRDTTVDPDERVLILSPTEWIELDIRQTPTGPDLVARPVTVDWSASNPGGGPPRAIVTMRECGVATGDNDYVLVQRADNVVIAFDVLGARITSALADELTAYIAPRTPRPVIASAGCIDQTDGAPLRAVLLEVPRELDAPATARRLYVDDPLAHADVFSFGDVAFAGLGVVDDAVLLGGVVDPTGTKLVRWRVSIDGDLIELSEEAREDSVGPPRSIVYGHVDGDGTLDTLWGLTDALQGGLSDARMQIALGCCAGDLTLNGVSPGTTSTANAVFLANPSNADDGSDVMIGFSRGAVFLDVAP